MYCPKCGAENPDGIQLCRSCSWVLASVSMTGIAPDAKTSKLAVTALVLAVLSPFTFCITAIPAMIFGIVGLFKIEKSAGRLKGKGLAITGIAVPAALIPFAIMMAILMPALAKVRLYRMTCGANMSSIGKAILIYSNDFGGKCPDTSQWCDLLIRDCNLTPLNFRCKDASEGPCNYAINKNIQEVGLANAPPDMVLLFETDPGWNQSGGEEILSTENHKGDGCNILFNDGHVAFILTENLDSLKWKPDEQWKLKNDLPEM